MLTFLMNIYRPKVITRPIIRYVSLDSIEKITPKLNILTQTRTPDDLRACDLSSCNLLAETNSFGLGAVLLSCLVSELQEPPYRESNSGHVYGVSTLLCSLTGFKE
jgi:hypothetical protein